MYVYIYIYVCMYVCMECESYIKKINYTHTHTHTHTYIYIYIKREREDSKKEKKGERYMGTPQHTLTFTICEIIIDIKYLCILASSS